MVIFNDLENQNELNAESARNKSSLNDSGNQNPDFVRRLIAVAAVVGVVGLIYAGAYMFRYEVIVIPKSDQSTVTVVQYIVKDRWTGEIEVIWHAPNGQVRQSKYHPFDGSRDADMQPAEPR